MERSKKWHERLSRWSARGGFLTTQQDVAEIVAPLEQRVAALERDVEHLRSALEHRGDK